MTEQRARSKQHELARKMHGRVLWVPPANGGGCFPIWITESDKTLSEEPGSPPEGSHPQAQQDGPDGAEKS
jgi:hypothetical protein